MWDLILGSLVNKAALPLLTYGWDWLDIHKLDQVRGKTLAELVITDWSVALQQQQKQYQRFKYKLRRNYKEHIEDKIIEHINKYEKIGLECNTADETWDLNTQIAHNLDSRCPIRKIQTKPWSVNRWANTRIDKDTQKWTGEYNHK